MDTMLLHVNLAKGLILFFNYDNYAYTCFFCKFLSVNYEE